MSHADPTTQSGVYQIRCLVNGKVYIGSAVDINHRWGVHRSDISTQTHHSRYLQRSWKKYGANQFVFEILELVPPTKEELIAAEQAWLDRIRPFDPEIGYNTSPTAGSPLGCKRTPEQRAKCSVAAKRQMGTPEARARIGEANRNRMVTAETRAKLSENMKRRMSDPAAKAKIAESSRNRIVTPEARANMSAAQKGRTFNDEARARMSESHKVQMSDPKARARIAASNRNRVSTPEGRAKASASQREKKFSDEARANMAVAAKARWKRKRDRLQSTFDFKD